MDTKTLVIAALVAALVGAGGGYLAGKRAAADYFVSGGVDLGEFRLVDSEGRVRLSLSMIEDNALINARLPEGGAPLVELMDVNGIPTKSVLLTPGMFGRF